jgi:hypothetical protein
MAGMVLTLSSERWSRPRGIEASTYRWGSWSMGIEANTTSSRHDPLGRIKFPISTSMRRKDLLRRTKVHISTNTVVEDNWRPPSCSPLDSSACAVMRHNDRRTVLNPAVGMQVVGDARDNNRCADFPGCGWRNHCRGFSKRSV